MSDSTQIDIIVKGRDQASQILSNAKDSVDEIGDAGKDAAKGLDKTAVSTKGIGDAASESKGSVSGLASSLLDMVTIDAGDLLGGIVAVGKALFSSAMDGDKALRTIQAQLGLTREQAEQLKPAIEDTFESGLVGSQTEAAAAIAETRKQFKGLADDELANVTKKALQVSNTFGDDYNKVLNSANTLSQQFGITNDQALDMIAAGYQKNLNASGDWLDSIGEYSNQWSSAGASADQFFSAQETGLQGGVLGLDKMNDAVKEFNIRIKDGSKSTRDALNDVLAVQGQVDTETISLNQSLDGLNNDLKVNAESLKAAEAAYDASQESVSGLKDQLSQARSELSALGSSDLAGMQAFDDQLFTLSQQANQLKRAMLDMTPDTGRIKALESELESTNVAIKDNEFALKNAQGAYAESQEVVDQLSDALSQARNELKGLARPNLAGMQAYDDQIFDTEQQIKRARLELMKWEKDTPEFDVAQQNLDNLNKQLDALTIQRDLEFDSQIRQIEQAAQESTEPVTTFGDAMQAIADKKTEIAGLEGALAGAQEQATANATAVEELTAKQAALGATAEAVKAALEAAKAPTPEYLAASQALDSLNAEMDRLSLERDMQFEPQIRAIQAALNDTGQPALTFDQTLQAIGEKKTQIADLEGALAGAEQQTAANATRVKELKDQQEFLNASIETTKEKLENVITPADKLLQDLADGKITEIELMQIVNAGLDKMDDKTRRNTDGVALYGSQWEDSTDKAILGVDLAKTKVEDLHGTVDDLNNANQDMGKDWTETQNEILTALQPVGDELIALANEYMPEIKAAGQWLAQFLRDNLPGAIDSTITGFHDFERGVAFVGSLITTVTDKAKSDFDAIVHGAEVVRDAFYGVRDAVQEALDKVLNLGSSFPSLDSIPDILRPGSPTPFEWGLRGIASEMGDLARNELPRLSAGLQIDTPLLPNLDGTAGGMGLSGATNSAAGGVYAPVTVQGSVVTERDLANAMVDMIRQISRQNGGLANMGIEL